MTAINHNSQQHKHRFSGTMFEHTPGETTPQNSNSKDEEMMAFLDNDNNSDDSKNEKQQQQDHHQLSDWETGISLAKAIMGAGSFALPWAFSNMGYVAGPLCLALLMWFSMISMRLLVQSNHNAGTGSAMCSSYVALARMIFGTAGARFSYGASVSASIGVCGSYLVFIAANMDSLTGQVIGQTLWILLVAPLAIMLSSIQNMKKFAMASLLGDVAVGLGMLVVVGYAVLYSGSSPKWDECVAVASYKTMPLSLGAIGYLFLIHFLVLPIQSNMRQPRNFCQIANRTFLVCAMVSGAFGVVGYLYFGSSTEQIVLLNIQDGPLVVQAVQLLLCVDLLFTYPVVMRPSIVILVQQQQDQNDNSKLVTPKQQQLRRSHHIMACIVLGLIAAGCSIFIPAFGILSGLVGGVSQTFLAFVLPPLMHLQQQQKQQPATTSGKNKMSLGLVGMGAVLILWTLSSTWNELSRG